MLYQTGREFTHHQMMGSAIIWCHMRIDSETSSGHKYLINSRNSNELSMVYRKKTTKVSYLPVTCLSLVLATAICCQTQMFVSATILMYPVQWLSAFNPRQDMYCPVVRSREWYKKCSLEFSWSSQEEKTEVYYTGTLRHINSGCAETLSTGTA